MRCAVCLALYILTLASPTALAAPDVPLTSSRTFATAGLLEDPLTASSPNSVHAHIIHRQRPETPPLPHITPPPPPSPAHRRSPAIIDVQRRQETTDDLTLFGTRTDDGSTAADSGGEGSDGGDQTTTAPPATPTTSVSHEWLTTSKLTPQESAVPLAATIGLILPNPWQSIYVEQEYRLGFIDAVRKPAPTVGGWMRQVTPLLIVPGNQVNTFDMTGPKDPSDPLAIPPQSDGLCGARVEDDAVRYPFVFHQPGWYMLVINQTWYQPTITENICALPYITQNTFFATHLLSVASLPTSGPLPPNPGPPHTVFAQVTVETPGRLPIDPGVMGRSAKLGVGLGVAFGVLALAAVVGMLWWANRRNKRQREEEVFNRMKPHEQQAFISENPTHFLNPHRADYIRAQRGVYRGTDMFGQPRPWWSRWGQGTGIGTMGGMGGMGGTGGQMYGSGMGHMGQYGQMGHMGPMGPYTGMAGMPGSGGQIGPQSAYTAVRKQRSQGETGGGGWKKWFSKGGGGVGAQQAYLAQQQQLLHQHQRAMSHGQPVAGVAGGGDGGHEYDQSKEAGYGYGEFGQPQYPHQPHTQGQDVRHVYVVPEYSYAGNAGQMGQVRQMGPGQGGQGQPVMVYPTAQRWQ